MSWNTAFEVVSAAAAACRGCGACVPRCEVLACAGGADEPLSVGEVAAAFADAAAGDDGESARAAVAALAAERPELVLAVRRCCMDGFCTLVCPDGIDARGVFSALRVLLHEARLTGDDGFTMTRVDQEWHIFSAYRAVHGIFYNDLPSLENARVGGRHAVLPWLLACQLCARAHARGLRVAARAGGIRGPVGRLLRKPPALGGFHRSL